MNKGQRLRLPGSCLNKAVPDEPMFVLLARDSLAAQTVRLWAGMAEALKLQPPAKIAEARQLAADMDTWRASRAVPRDAAETKPNRDAF